ncbi:MAG: hypothetical protein AABY10_05935 [Nanoarchaeota archaeon]
MKAVVLDSGPLINLSMNGILYILKGLKEKTGVRFLITKEVRSETIDKPTGIPRFELGALMISQLLKEGTLEMPDNAGIRDERIKEITTELMDYANHTLSSNGKFINIVSPAEISCLALSKLLSEKNIESLVAVDERTTRTLGENPESLEEIMSKKMHTIVKINKKNLGKFSNFNFIRSTELVLVAFKLGVLEIKDPRALEAVLYATKFKGAAVSFDEINILKKM